MSQAQDWNAPRLAPAYHQHPQDGRGYQQPQEPYGYAPAPYQQPYSQGHAPQVVPKNAGTRC